jgi:predicted DNA-binding transcriptional regulator YafY
MDGIGSAMRSQRLIACLQLLQGERRLTARYLSEQLEISMRTVYRDVEALCEAGVPIHMERGPLGGIVLADGYRRALAQFTNEELQSLFVAGSGPMADLGIGSHREALRKLAGALPTQQRQNAKAMRERLLLDHTRWGRGEQPTALLVQLRRAVDAQRRVRLEYRDRNGSITDRLVDPLGLVAKAGVWYLIAAEAAKGFRTFRAQRIIAVTTLAQSFSRPPDFDLEAYWNSSVESIERQAGAGYNVILRVRADGLHALRLYWESAVIEQDADSATLRITFPSRGTAVAEILTFEHVIDIVSPPDLVDAVVAYAEAAVRKYRRAAARPAAP